MQLLITTRNLLQIDDSNGLMTYINNSATKAGCLSGCEVVRLSGCLQWEHTVVGFCCASNSTYCEVRTLVVFALPLAPLLPNRVGSLLLLAAVYSVFVFVLPARNMLRGQVYVRIWSPIEASPQSTHCTPHTHEINTFTRVQI